MRRRQLFTSGRGRVDVALMAALCTLAATVSSWVIPGLVAPAGADVATIREFPIPAPNPDPGPFIGNLLPGLVGDITTGPDGNVWLSELLSNQIARVTPAGVFTEFPVGPNPSSITAGPDGNLWFLGGGDCTVNRMKVAGAVTGTFPIPVSNPNTGCEPSVITVGPDQNLWFTDWLQGELGRVTTAGVITLFPVTTPDNAGGVLPLGITAGPDGNLWFTESNGNPPTPQAPFLNSIGRMTTAGVVTNYPIPTPNAVATSITAGPDGELWFTEFNGNRVGRITTVGVITEFPTSPGPSAITPGPDGNLWYTAFSGDRIGRITTAGAVIDELRPPTAQAGPVSITRGSDGKMWFHEVRANKVASFSPASIGPNPAPCLVVTASTTLAHDIGPCQGDGIVVAADNVTLNLNGHRVRGRSLHRDIAAGIRVPNHKGVTIKGPGQVAGFDAGVVLGRGRRNTISGLDIHDNTGPADPFADLGDGILVLNSADNQIIGNTVSHNGVYDGIGILGPDSNHNLVRGNTVQTTLDVPGPNGLGVGIITNAFFDPNSPRRGASIVGNDIMGNKVKHNSSAGISNLSNIFATISGNTVSDNGYHADGSPGVPPGNGIGVQHLANAVPETHDLIENNLVRGNRADGIVIGGAGASPALQNTIQNNTSAGNVVGPVSPAAFDLEDFSPNCATNVWLNNMWGSGGFDPPCTTTGGSPAPSAQAAFTPQAEPEMVLCGRGLWCPSLPSRAKPFGAR